MNLFVYRKKTEIFRIQMKLFE